MSAERNTWGTGYGSDDASATPLAIDDYDPASYRRSSEEEVKQGWLIRPDRETRQRKKRSSYVNCLMIKSLLISLVVGGLVVLIVMLATRRRHHHPGPGPDNYTVALHRALRFFDAQQSGRLPAQNNVSWRGDSCLKDEIVGGFYDGGSAIKFNFPGSFAMTLLSWSVIEYSAKYNAIGELGHVKGIIKWGSDYLLKSFKSSNGTISSVATQVGGEHDESCWMRPEDIDSDGNYPRRATWCTDCPALSAEMAAALSAASIVFKDDEKYSKKLVHGADMLFKFATKGQGANYDGGRDLPSKKYNSTGYWDEFVWGGAWLYYATGNSSYLQFVTTPSLVNNDPIFSGGAKGGVFGWDTKHAGAHLLLSRVRIYLSYGYPYEGMLRTYQKRIEEIICSYQPRSFRYGRIKGGLIDINRARPNSLQYVVNAAFMTTLYSDYLEGRLVPGLVCGPIFYSNDVLRDFARTQINYILGNNHRNRSYVVGFGNQFPQHVHHRGASIPDSKIKYGCKGGLKWRDSRKKDPNTIVGAMVAGPGKRGYFRDYRADYNYTEPTIAGNAGLVAALVALSGGNASTFDKNTIFSAVPPL
ncbi:hypothetical protein Tsubulata_004229 [Turnera subulata]|uniref:Endoglucanase n=1 Tax=Turnera subulata TaxID=218843 RepID=A0A9Q0JDF7_9ROSI|nr:hypothetical protein Tsubulata_004229 [Turnera subulata]